MNEQAQRIALAEFCGWQAIELRYSEISGKHDWLSGLNPKPDEIVKVIDAESGEERAPNESDYGYETLPDYLRDLNAIHDAESKLTKEQSQTYVAILVSALRTTNLVLTNENTFNAIHAKADQKAKAILKVIGEWTDGILPRYEPIKTGYFCITHNRPATRMLLREGMEPTPCCEGPGIMLPCECVKDTQ